ncbi:hypothetical protein, partial [Rhizobium sp.]|uniref:hypothetical protein n=1 Tax=Rhizobium sp. TaxID=391 RepID=UPI0028AFF6C4
PWPHNSNQMASGKPGAVQGDLYDGRSLGIELIFRRYVIVPMTHIQHTEPTHVAADFVELMRSDFDGLLNSEIFPVCTFPAWARDRRVRIGGSCFQILL